MLRRTSPVSPRPLDSDSSPSPAPQTGVSAARPSRAASPAATAPVVARTPVRITPSVDLVEALENSGTFHFTDLDVTTELPTVAVAPSVGKRRAVKHAGSRGPLFRGLPSPPILLGLATLAVAVGGVLTSTGPDLASNQPALRPASALTGESGVAGVNSMRNGSVSRSADRSAADDASGSELLAAAEAQAEERNDALGQMRDLAEKQAKFLADNRWILPLTPSIITATFGQYGLWSSYHTGLDFNGENGDPIHSIAPGTVTFTGYDGAYGNKTVVTLEDGTELWYCHQTSIGVSVGDSVSQGEVIGTVGSTGNVTGSHLHVEVRPGGGDPVDPYAAFVVHGVTP
ncbi:M23 family metallopeptidase [Nocardioides sp. R-C-SC26]|uniref:M23 family metallopeptidase n=1 Tax=Nocardioides sp. R-C-SC26 TaxID=2870414 RepID=UPI0027E0284C|nr:M23 family metallopeptidase [Nocardioides sp. R-C-SC26]